jgi:hypothetical protein
VDCGNNNNGESGDCILKQKLSLKCSERTIRGKNFHSFQLIPQARRNHTATPLRLEDLRIVTMSIAALDLIAIRVTAAIALLCCFIIILTILRFQKLYQAIAYKLILYQNLGLSLSSFLSYILSVLTPSLFSSYSFVL